MPELLSKNAKPDTLPLILEQKLAAFREFLSATASLKERLLSQDIKQVDSLIDHRQKLIIQIDGLDNRIKNITTQAGAILMGTAQGKERQINALSVALEETIVNVIKVNKDCTSIAAGLRDELGKEVPVISNERLALRGYAGGIGSGNNRVPRLFSLRT